MILDLDSVMAKDSWLSMSPSTSDFKLEIREIKLTTVLWLNLRNG